MLTAGENLTLHCMLKGFGPPGAVKWQKGTDRSQPPVYNDKEPSSSPTSRVARIIPGSNMDYSIRISNIQLKDAGTYFCLKYKAGFPETEYKSGMGTEVLVLATPSLPKITGPPGRVDSGASVTFNCRSDGFFPRIITLTWIKDRRTILASWIAVVPPEESTSYQVMSAVNVTLTERDVKSELTCQIHHSTLPGPLQKSFKLGDALRVTPKMSVEPGQLIEAVMNELVTITCSAKGFYPNDTGLAWKENGSETDLPMAESTTQDYDGMFSMRSILEINATEQRNHSIFTCYAVRNSQPLDPVNVTLKIHREEAGQRPSFNPGVWVGFGLNKIVVLLLLFFFLRKMLSQENQGTSGAAAPARSLQENPAGQ
uniref:Uncharacterized protein n=1 Tax=Sphaerodactylus townsendi TaxID=933632 RepID=A0ACB8F6J8_9SAUR